jgi:hypothetical protein
MIFDSSSLDKVGRKHAGRIWGFISKFVMLDRFGKTLGAAEVYPGLIFPKTMRSDDFYGTASKVSIIKYFTLINLLIRLEDSRRA